MNITIMNVNEKIIYIALKASIDLRETTEFKKLNFRQIMLGIMLHAHILCLTLIGIFKLYECSVSSFFDLVVHGH